MTRPMRRRAATNRPNVTPGIVLNEAWKLGCEGIVSKRIGLTVSVRALTALDQGQKPESASGEARGGGELGPMTVGRYLLLLGFVCLVIVVLTHVAETLHVLPRMGWGLPDSPGEGPLLTILLAIALIIGTTVTVKNVRVAEFSSI